MFAHELAADSIEHAQSLSRTRFFWWVSYLADLKNWDWFYEPPTWQAHQRHAWLDQYQVDAGVYLVPATGYTDTNYHTDRRIHRLPDTSYWNIPEWIDPSSIDTRWAPNSTDPPYIYEFPVEWNWDRIGGPEYRIPGATERKYVDNFAAKTWPNPDAWYQHCAVEWPQDVARWRPDPMDPPYNYVFGNQWYSAEIMPTVEYRVPGATERKYMSMTVHLPEQHNNRWHTLHDCKWDYSWVPDPGDPPYIYVFGNQWHSAEIMPTVEYHVPGATERKYMDLVAELIDDRTNWTIPLNVDPASIDYSWVPDPGDPPYIYEFATQWQPNGGAVYIVPGATDRKYIDIAHRVFADKTNWVVSTAIDKDSVDYSWHPSNTELPYIYEFATQWQPNGGACYHVPGATERKYVEIQHCRLPDQINWNIPDTIDSTSIDYSWHPSNTEQPFIYEFATQWQPNGGASYVVSGATERKYIEIQHQRLSDLANWTTPGNIDSDSVDYSWHPSNTEQPYIYEFATQWQPNGGACYHVPGATERKYVEIQHSSLPDKKYWNVSDTIDSTSIDYSWHPSNTELPYIYEFATQWQPNGGAVYAVYGATERKYVEIQHRRLPDNISFTELEVLQDFDYSWHPDNTEPPYNYVFGNQHWAGTEMPTVVYNMPGATQEKFVDNVVAKLAGCMDNWEFCEDIDDNTWDWTWVPNPQDPPYIYVFGNQWNPPEFKASIKYVVAGATEVKYMDRRTTRLPQPQLFRHNIAVSKFDYSWEPNPFDPPMTYVFGNQWNSAVLEPTVIFNAGGDEIKYVDDIRAQVAQDMSAWELLDDIEEFDYSWRPNPTDPPYTYVFGNQWLTPEQRPALQYVVAESTAIKYMDYPKARRQRDPGKFVQLYPCEFDWSWEPDPGNPPYTYVFGNQYYSAETMPTLTYTVTGAIERKYMDISTDLLPNYSSRWNSLVNCEWDYTWRPEPGSPPYIYVFGNQWWPAEVMPSMEYHMPGATERKYMTAPVATLPVDMTLWHVPAHVDVSDMDFSWTPDPGEPPYIYQFATQHQKTGGPQYRMPSATEFKYVDMMRAEVKKEAAPVFEIDHLDGNAGNIEGVVRKVRYFDNYRDTLIRLAKSLVGEYEHVWICSSICDYSNFDFTWHPETWQSTMLHVFASDKEKFGDTFYMHVPTFAERAEKKQLLEWYSVNYVPRRSVPRRPMPVIQHTADSHVDAVKNTTWAGPLATFTTTDSVLGSTITVPLWRKETKTIVPLTKGATSVIVPRVAVSHIKTQLYDYPYIDKSYRGTSNAIVQDVVFISYDEPEADQNWKILKDHCPRAVRVHGVSGMELALEAAADVSTTPWFFAVFAKTQLHKEFDFSVVPDRMQLPKHYIFNCRNASNNLEYGHMGVVLYNCQGVRDINRAGNFGLDYTLSFPHESVPLLSCHGDFATTPYHAWRTAFRETAKLAYFEQTQPSVDNHYRLGIWLTHAEGNHADWVLKGANDGNEFYKTTNSDLTTLKQSFRWEWLREYFVSKYSSELK